MSLEKLFLQSFCEFLIAKKALKFDTEKIIDKYYKKSETTENTKENTDTIESLDFFTDGSVINNGKRNAKGGYGVYLNDCQKYSFSYDEEFWGCPATNQNCELLAIQHAVGMIKQNINKIQNFTIYSDSLYSINCITKWAKAWKKNGWKTSTNDEVKNKEIIENIFNTISPFEKRASFVHVRSHKTEPRDKTSKEWMIWYGNESADKLAKQGMIRERNKN